MDAAIKAAQHPSTSTPISSTQQQQQFHHQQHQQPAQQPPAQQPAKKMCCACPETKKPRDECVVKNGEEKCKELIEAHKVCLRKEGFNV